MLIYILKFIASFILPPGIIILVLICILSLLLRRGLKTLVIFLGSTIFILYILSTGFFSSLLIQSLESKYSPPEDIYGDVVIMLGGGATADTPDTNGVGNLSGSAANRLITAARIQRQLGVPIIVSGGQVFEDSGKEAVIAQRVLLGLGIPEDKIIIEDRSLNTQQNAIYTKELLEKYGFRQPILVTSAFHMDRAVINFNKQGVAVQPYPSDYLSSKKQSFNPISYTPSSSALDISCIYFREMLGIVAAKIR